MTHDPGQQPTPDPTPPQGPPPGAVLSPDGKQWFDPQASTWHPVPRPTPTAESTKAANRKAWIALGVVALVIGVPVIAMSGVIPNLLKGDQRLVEARHDCIVGVLGDDGRSLTVDTNGEKRLSGFYDFEDLDCALRVLKVPDATRQKMLETTSMQGRQTDSWDGIEASWTYHPDNGLDVILELED